MQFNFLEQDTNTPFCVLIQTMNEDMWKMKRVSRNCRSTLKTVCTARYGITSIFSVFKYVYSCDSIEFGEKIETVVLVFLSKRHVILKIQSKI